MTAGLFIPQIGTQAAPIEPDGGTGWVDPSVRGVLMSMYVNLKHQYSRTRNDVNPLNGKLNRLLNNYKLLQKKGSSNWDEMRVLYYDFNSAYHAALDHKWEAEYVLDHHYGFNSRGKVTNAVSAKLTVMQLRGAVLAMKARTEECRDIYRKAVLLMKSSKAFTKNPK
jgi:hypothetical protein